jgi:hypothetical protein
MRTLLAAIVLAALIVTGVAAIVPLIARPIVVAAVQAASPFGSQRLDIDVDLNVFGLLRGTIDRIHVRGTSLKRGDVTIAAMDVTLTDVATSGHEFRGATGTLATIQVPTNDTSSLTIDEVKLAGPSSALIATASLDRAAATHLVTAAFADGGIEVGAIELGAGTITFQAFGARVEVPIGVEDGAIVVVDPFGTGSFELVTPGADDGWRFTGVAVAPGGLTIDASLDVEKLLAAR